MIDRMGMRGDCGEVRLTERSKTRTAEPQGTAEVGDGGPTHRTINRGC